MTEPPGFDGEACFLRPADVARYDKLGGLAARKASRYGASLLGRHGLLDVEFDLVATGPAYTLQCCAQQVVGRV